MKNYIIPIFIPHYGCIHQCVFCNQKKITGLETPITPIEVASVIEEHLARINQLRNIEVAYYGGSFTALPLRKQRELLQPAYVAFKEGRIHAIRLSTRPDCITKENLNQLIELGVSIIELGAQSLNDSVLFSAARGHSTADVVNAVKLIKQFGIKCGLQLMIGLPNENWSHIIQTSHVAVKLAPDFIRIYPTLVIADTPLAKSYNAGKYRPLSIDQAVARCAFMKNFFERSAIPVIRTGLQATEELSDSSVVLAGPYHPAFGELVDSYLFKMIVVSFLESVHNDGQPIILHHHPRDTSKIRGLKNSNLLYWQNTYKANIEMVADGQKTGQILIDYGHLKYLLTNKIIEE